MQVKGLIPWPLQHSKFVRHIWVRGLYGRRWVWRVFICLWILCLDSLKVFVFVFGFSVDSLKVFVFVFISVSILWPAFSRDLSWRNCAMFWPQWPCGHISIIHHRWKMHLYFLEILMMISNCKKAKIWSHIKSIFITGPHYSAGKYFTHFRLKAPIGSLCISLWDILQGDSQPRDL